MITQRDVAALQAILSRDIAAYDRLGGDSLLSPDTGLPVLIAHAFTTAAHQHFRQGWSDADVIRFVGQVRADNGAELSDIDTDTAEQMLVSVLRGIPAGGGADEAKGYAQLALLAALVKGLNDGELGQLLLDARISALDAD